MPYSLAPYIVFVSEQALLDDAHRQIHNQEKMLQHISHSLREKDKLLQEYMRLVDDQEVRQAMLNICVSKSHQSLASCR